MKRLVVVPADSISDDLDKGLDSEYLNKYFNPNKFWDEVYLLSNLEKGKRKLGDLQVIGVNPWTFRYWLRKLKPDLIRAYGGYVPCDFAAYSRIKKYRLLVSVHDKNEHMLYNSIKYADYVFTTSRAVYDLVKSRGIDEKVIYELPDSIDTNIFSPNGEKESIIQFGKGKYVLHVARADYMKNTLNLIKAFTSLPQEYKLIWIGGGEKKQELNLIKELNLENRCFILGAINNKELPKWYRACDCFCVPSRAEGFGDVFIEAAACGAAIIATNIRPLNEIMTDGENACLEINDPDNYVEIAQAIRHVCEDKEYCEHIKHNAVELGKKYSKDNINKMEIELYNTVMQGDVVSPKYDFDYYVNRFIFELKWLYKLTKDELYKIKLLLMKLSHKKV